MNAKKPIPPTPMTEAEENSIRRLLRRAKYGRRPVDNSDYVVDVQRLLDTCDAMKRELDNLNKQIETLREINDNTLVEVATGKQSPGDVLLGDGRLHKIEPREHVLSKDCWCKPKVVKPRPAKKSVRWKW